MNKRTSSNRRLKSIAVYIIIAAVAAGVFWIFTGGRGSPIGGKNKIALQERDPVAYFKLNRAVKGNPEVAWRWNGLTWFFINERNKTLFMAEPAAYAPQYGGNCAYSTSLGKEQTGLAKYWEIREGKLYLNANPISHFLWRRQPKRVKKADREWLRLNAEKLNKEKNF